MTSTSFNVNEQVDATLLALMQHYGLPSRAAVIGRALALLKACSTHEHPDGSVYLRRPDGAIVRVRMAPGAAVPQEAAPGPTAPPEASVTPKRSRKKTAKAPEQAEEPEQADQPKRKAKPERPEQTQDEKNKLAKAKKRSS